MACEVGLYYVLHITKQRNKNALLRLLPGLGECARGGTPLSSQTPSALCPRHSLRSPRAGTIFPNGRGAWSFPSRQTRARAPHRGGAEASSPGEPCSARWRDPASQEDGRASRGPSGASCRLSRGAGASRGHPACPAHTVLSGRGAFWRGHDTAPQCARGTGGSDTTSCFQAFLYGGGCLSWVLVSIQPPPNWRTGT